ncbi:MAG: winged helix-turn-helix transcriptional regulator [Hamadaea sp.]|nr:winged helix-turn-helix transcriptional regulator [Hamadaea sp.]
MLRIHFTAADLGSLRLASAPDPLWESLLSQHVLASGKGPPQVQTWRRRAVTRLTPHMRILMRLAPSTGYSPDFLTPTTGLRGIEAGIDAVLSTPPERLRADLARMSAQRPLPGWARRLADGDRPSLQALGAAMRDYFDAVLASSWGRISAQVAGERARGARTMTDRGVDRLLTTLHPQVRWEAPVLRVAYPDDRDLHLDGRGLVLVPSFFCWGRPVTLRAADRPPVLVYPIEHDADPHQGADRNLVALLGRTRSAILRAAGDHPHGCSTGEVARAVGVSASSASEHVTTLRRAGLLRSRPSGKQVLHVVTDLGRALLRADRADEG